MAGKQSFAVAAGVAILALLGVLAVLHNNGGDESSYLSAHRSLVSGHHRKRSSKSESWWSSLIARSQTLEKAADGCKDKPEGWHDKDGSTYNCEWYATDTNCAQFGGTYKGACPGPMCMNANEACCACGGGETPPAPAASQQPQASAPPAAAAAEPAEICHDEPTNWHDSGGADYDCAWYAGSDNCEKFGSDEQWKNQGKTANEACCACGGGKKETPPPPPTPAPEPAGCTSDPPNWHDSGGTQYNCAWYAQGSNCADYGSDEQWKNQGKTASEACCQCGGGSGGGGGGQQQSDKTQQQGEQQAGAGAGAGAGEAQTPFWFGCAAGAGYNRLRTDWNKLTDAEKTLYFKAVNKLYETGQYQTFVRIHGDLYNKAYAHGTSGFLPWHRKFLMEYENALRASLGDESKCVTVPYWDWAEGKHDCEILQEAGQGHQCDTYHETYKIIEDFGGPGTGGGDKVHGGSAAGCVTEGPFANWEMFLYDGYSGSPKQMCLSRGKTLTKEGKTPLAGHFDLMDQFLTKEYIDYEPLLEGVPHAMPHNNLMGHMRSFISPADPLFFSHHCYIDKAWAVWQDCHDYDKTDFSMGGDIPPEQYTAKCCKEGMTWGDTINRNCCQARGGQIKNMPRGPAKVKGAKKTGKLPYGRSAEPWMSDEADTPMPFWYPKPRFGEGSTDFDMCESGSELIPSWTDGKCKPREYLTTQFMPGDSSYRYIRDEFENQFAAETAHSHTAKDLCKIEAPTVTHLTLSLEQQMSQWGGTVLQSKFDKQADLERLPGDVTVLDLERKVYDENVPAKHTSPVTKKQLGAIQKLSEQNKTMHQIMMDKEGPIAMDCLNYFKEEQIKEMSHMDEAAFMGLKCYSTPCDELTESEKKAHTPCGQTYCLNTCLQIFAPDKKQPKVDEEKGAYKDMANDGKVKPDQEPMVAKASSYITNKFADAKSYLSWSKSAAAADLQQGKKTKKNKKH